MRKELVINNIIKESNSVICNITECGIEKTIFIKTEEAFSDYLVYDRADSFFIIALYKAAREGYNLISKVPVSERLLFQASNFFKQILSETYNVKEIEITAPSTIEKISSANAVGTGITGGVDSLYTIAMNGKDNLTSWGGYLLTHLVLLNVGSHDIGAEDSASLFESRIKLAKSFCNSYDYKFVLIDTNINEFLKYSYTEYFSIINSATILSLQKLFKCYYSSSGYSIKEFKLSSIDASHFELFNMNMLSTDATVFFTYGGGVSRYDKVRVLTSFEPSYEFLNVCNSYSYNCSKRTCIKCLRTITELDATNSLHKYKKVFDLELYENNKESYLSDMYARKVLLNDEFAKEIWSDLRKKYRIPLTYKIRSIIRFIYSRLKIYNIKTIMYRLKMSK